MKVSSSEHSDNNDASSPAIGAVAGIWHAQIIFNLSGSGLGETIHILFINLCLVLYKKWILKSFCSMAADNGLCISSNIYSKGESTIDCGVLCKITACICGKKIKW